MFKYNLIGFEDNYYQNFERPKNLVLLNKKLSEINNRTNRFKQSVLDNSFKSRENSNSKHTRKSSFYNPSKIKYIYLNFQVSEYNKDLSNLILSKKLIDISNRDLVNRIF